MGTPDEPWSAPTRSNLVDDESLKGAVKYSILKDTRRKKCFKEGVVNGIKHW